MGKWKKDLPSLNNCSIVFLLFNLSVLPSVYRNFFSNDTKLK
jgi:hypothetical protein